MTDTAGVDRLIRVGEAAEILQVSRSTVRRWTDMGALNFRLTPSGQRRYVRDDVERLLREGHVA